MSHDGASTVHAKAGTWSPAGHGENRTDLQVSLGKGVSCILRPRSW